jgi:methionyl-tRNA synthetase
MDYVSYDEFKKMDMRIGTIRAVEPVEGTDKLLKCQIDFGLKPAPQKIDSLEQSDEQVDLGTPESDIRQIVSGIREYFPEYEQLVGKQVLYIVNLEPRTIRGIESNGMLMAVDGKDGKPVFLTPEIPVLPGAKVR